MASRVFFVFCMAAVCFSTGANGSCAESEAKAEPFAEPEQVTEAKRLSKQIDRILLNRMKNAKLNPALAVDAAGFSRRLHLDLAGRIPTLLEVRDYLSEDRPKKIKLIRTVEDLLSGAEYARNFANVWRSIMLPQTPAGQNSRGNYSQFELWLQDALKKNQPYDVIAKSAVIGTPQSGALGSPAVFQNAHGAKPEELASATARVFLGVRLGCAQCHSHPFAKWTRDQFWETAAFFSSSNEIYGPGGQFFRQTIKIPKTKRIVKATFLDGKPPPFSNKSGRVNLAEWIARKDNPFFAKAAVDHVWTYFFGLSLLEPIRRKDKDAVQHPELLDKLAHEFAAHDFDLKYLIRAIIYSDTYSRSSQSKSKDANETQYFARMPVRGLSPEQLYDSFQVATQLRKPDLRNVAVSQGFYGQQTEREKFIEKFADQYDRTEKNTSILQALFLMNGEFLGKRVNPDNNNVIQVLATQPTSDRRRLESLYMMVLSRPPRDDELRRYLPYVTKGGVTANRRQALSDIYWALLNSSEFMLNH